MGDPRKLRKKYQTPKHPWRKERINEENKIQKEYGLTNKTEIWKAEEVLRKYRGLARQIVGIIGEEKKEKESKLISKLVKMGLLKEGSTIDNVLSLTIRDILERRLQTQVWKQGMGKTIKQARQLIVHGHIGVKGRKTTAPGCLIEKEDETKILWYGNPVDLEIKPPKKGEKKEEVNKSETEEVKQDD